MDNLEEIETPEKEAQENSQKWENNQDDLVTRYKQLVHWSREETKRFKNLIIESEVKNASKDAWSLLELHKKDPKLADEVAKRFWYNNFDEAKSVIDKNDTDYYELEKKTVWFTEDEFERLYKKRRDQEEHEKALKKVDKLFSKLDESIQEKAKQYFDKITEWKTLDTDTAIEFAEMTTLYVNKDKLKSEKFDNSIAMLSSNWLSDNKKVSNKWSNEKKYIVRNWQLILDTNKQ